MPAPQERLQWTLHHFHPRAMMHSFNLCIESRIIHSNDNLCIYYQHQKRIPEKAEAYEGSEPDSWRNHPAQTRISLGMIQGGIHASEWIK